MDKGNTKKIWDILYEVSDPEIPVLSIVDLGTIRDVKQEEEFLEVGGWEWDEGTCV